ncbi:MAG: hypothetical protein LQ352_002020 [Teloschistes flavicans]|nr:MAG: hypothetical protein LQ352_002020 [Teloschistes flavicans]
MRVYLYDNQPGDCRLPHDSGMELARSHLSTLGVVYYSFPPSLASSRSAIEEMALDSGYAGRDEITISPDAMGAAYEEKIKMFFDEHMHEDEEIRYIVAGNGFFDVRDAEDKWIRIHANPGDLLVLPAGIYHRFTLDEDNYLEAMRLFQKQPKWAALNRSEETDNNAVRKKYVHAVQAGHFAA